MTSRGRSYEVAPLATRPYDVRGTSYEVAPLATRPYDVRGRSYAVAPLGTTSYDVRTGQRTRTSRMRSSPAAGSPRPSRLLVVSQRFPSGAATTVRTRPYLPTNQSFGRPVPPSAVTGTCQSRPPRSA